MSFDLSLARGLDYYTGIIYEAVTADSAPPKPTAANASPEAKAEKDAANTQANGANPEDEDAKVGVGSIAAGGRYDNLVSMFSANGTQIPCVGISFGVERIFSILWKKRLAQFKDNMKSKDVDVFVMAVGDGLLIERMQIAKELWDAGLKVSYFCSRWRNIVQRQLTFASHRQTEFLYKAKPKARPQFDVIERDQIPFAVIIGASELQDGKVRIKEQLGKESALTDSEKDKDGHLIDRSSMIDFIRSRMSQK